jgi:hypothetical protein
MGVTNEGRRTQALRSPVAGGFTPPTSVAASNPCLNCGTNIQLAFCPECGQREIDTDPTFKDYAREVGADLLQKEGKVARTFRMLVLRPGELTCEYHDGRRVRYVTPIRLFLSCAAIFLVLHSMMPERLLSGNRLLNQAPVLMGYMFRDRRRNYPQHLVFGLHVHAVAFLALCVALIGAALPAGAMRTVFEALVLAPLALYAIRGAQRVYNSSTGQAVARTLIAAALYLVVIAGIASI